MKIKPIRTLADLEKHGLVQPEVIPALTEVVANFSLSISAQMAELIDPHDANDPIAKQFVPQTKELQIAPEERRDPIGDDAFTTVNGVIHRYPDRCLLTPVLVCPVYCRFCFRREKIAAQEKMLSLAELEAAYAYIAAHPEIREVILTGGDPLILKPQQLHTVLSRLSALEQIEVLRIHTRIPIVDPARIQPDMIAALKCGKPLYIVLHANHPKEFTAAATQACAALVDAGLPMLGQTVLLKNLNDNIEVLSQLMRCFSRNRIHPYYLHHADLTRGTQHFRTTIAEGQTLMKQLRGRLSGICQPTYVLDIPGGHGKMPIGPCYLQANTQTEEENRYFIEDNHGVSHAYPRE